MTRVLARWWVLALLVVGLPDQGFGKDVDSVSMNCGETICWELLNPDETAGVELSGESRDFCELVAGIEDRLIVPADTTTPEELGVALKCPATYREVELVTPTDEHLQQFVQNAGSQVRHVRILGVSGTLSVANFVALGTFQNLESVHMVSARFEVPDEAPAFRSDSIKSLVIQGHEDAVFIDWLLSTETIGSLTSLSVLQLVRENRLSHDTVCRVLAKGERLRELVLSPRLREPIDCPVVATERMRTMYLAGIGDQTARALAAATLPELRQLAIHRPGLQGDHIAILFTGSWASNLISLGLREVDMRSEQTYVLGRLPALERLQLQDSTIEPTLLLTLEKLGLREHLQVLRIRGSGELVVPPRPWHIWPMLELMDYDRIESRDHPLYQYGLCALGIRC